MTITEILQEIHKERVELEVCSMLQKWLLEDRDKWIGRAMDAEATIRAVCKMAKGNENAKNAIKGIVDICDSDLED